MCKKFAKCAFNQENPEQSGIYYIKTKSPEGNPDRNIQFDTEIFYSPLKL